LSALFPSLLLHDHAKNRSSYKGQILYSPDYSKDQLSDPVIPFNQAEMRPAVLFEIMGGNSFEQGGGNRGFSRPIGCSDAVLVEAADAAVTDENQPVMKGSRRSSDVHSGRALTSLILPTPIGRKTLSDFRVGHKRFYEIPILALSKDAGCNIFTFGDEGGKVQAGNV
jgi:hypothetical protein